MQTTMQPKVNHQTVHEVWTKAGPIEAASVDAVELRKVEEVHQAQIGDATPMGVFGFAVGTMVIGFVLAGITPMTGLPAAIPSVLVFAGVGQFIAGLYALSKGNTFAGTVMCSFGANNVIVSTFIWMQTMGLIPSNHAASVLIGVDLCCLAYISLALAIAATRMNAVFVATLLALIPGYALPGIRYFGASSAVGHIGGWFLILAAVLAFYGAAALVINSTHQRQVLSLGRIAKD